jgi:predicted dehydrogenase
MIPSMTTSLQLNRRQFLHKSTAAALMASAWPVLGAAPATRKYRTALIGCGWWGNNILSEAMASGECRIVGLCDVDRGFLQDTVERVTRATGDTAKGFRHYREMLAEVKPEIVIVGTPDHWHPLQTIDSVRAGAHVFVEKPIGHTIREGRAMVNAARQTGKVVQVGTHRRVSPHNVSGRDFIRSGKLGKVGMVRSFVHYGGSGPERPRKNIEPPPHLDWDLWCGPAPMRPFNGDPDTGRGGIHPRGFRNYLDYANGTLGDWGIHWMDQVVWIMEQKWPRTVFSTGGRPIKGPPILTAAEQTTDAPDHQIATFEFDGFSLTWEHRQFAANHAEKGENVGCYFYGTEGTLHMGWREGWVFYPANTRQPTQHAAPQLNEPDHQNIKELWADLLHCIKTGRKPVCDIEEVHYSTNLSLLGMLSLRIGRSLAWDGRNETIVGDPDADRLLQREYRKGWEYPKA